jgi:DNA-binding NtrC family response regulator
MPATVKPKVIFIDDEKDLAASLAEKFSAQYDTLAFLSAEEALGHINNDVAVVVADHRMPGLKGVALLARIRKDNPEIGRVLLTAVGDIIPLGELLNDARPNYVPKTPELFDHLGDVLADAVAGNRRRRNLDQERSQLRAALRVQTGHQRLFTDLIGTDQALRAAIASGRVAAKHDHLKVLITGETGTGKDYMARAIHFEGVRRERPFVKCNWAHFQRQLAQSVLFGQERNVFTGAEQKHGTFRDADGGTVFLDEIGDMDLETQPSLLALFDGGEVHPLGYSGKKRITVDVRIIAATNKDLRSEVSAGRFRGDLLARLSDIEINMPPLRDRKADIPLIARHFVIGAARDFGLDSVPIDESVDVYLQSLTYPGNFRDLSSMINKAIVEMVKAGEKALELRFLRIAASSQGGASVSNRGSLDEALSAFTKQFLATALRRNGYNNVATAKDIVRTDRNVRELREKFNL